MEPSVVEPVVLATLVEEAPDDYKPTVVDFEDTEDEASAEVSVDALPIAEEVLVSTESALKHLGEAVLSTLEKEFNGKPSEMRALDNKDRIF
jgi:hypothetical protein